MADGGEMVSVHRRRVVQGSGENHLRGRLKSVCPALSWDLGAHRTGAAHALRH